MSKWSERKQKIGGGFYGLRSGGLLPRCGHTCVLTGRQAQKCGSVQTQMPRATKKGHELQGCNLFRLLAMPD